MQTMMMMKLTARTRKTHVDFSAVDTDCLIPLACGTCFYIALKELVLCSVNTTGCMTGCDVELGCIITHSSSG